MNPRARADLEAYDALPPRVRQALREAPVNLDATFLLLHVEAGYPEHLIVTAISNARDR